ncbi:hypothetical protein C8N32_11233 [Rhodovulum imhoffii]|uniref:Uncharacterized protein n=1 Tax=Rhodovulum imhoffii TaxID=365340 RepID=A0A2T5BQP3_9RHOB|nr:hypothetical protein [Rhodovulum imhoffii]MBK5933889.1 hypothetical protein [Rhodovulum imhoffii]PTN01523.1 hypothetical protein C8N32_11233 [Rhodovulum imhoffii]
MRLFLVMILLCSAAQADPPLSGARFEAHVMGKTLYYKAEGETYGAEQYLTDRRVIWAFLGGPCTQGYWYEDAEKICFLYEHAPKDPQCWRFYLRDGVLSARFDGELSESLIEIFKSRHPLRCAGPQAGV